MVIELNSQIILNKLFLLGMRINPVLKILRLSLWQFSLVHLFRWLMKSYPKLQISPHAPFCINWEIFYLCYSMNTPSANILGPYTEIYPFPAVQSSILLSMILVLNSNLPYSFKMPQCACVRARLHTHKRPACTCSHKFALLSIECTYTENVTHPSVIIFSFFAATTYDMDFDLIL